MARITRHLSYSNAVATLCLFLLLGAGAHAAGLGKNSVKSKHIKDGQVKTADLGPSSVDGSKVKANTLTGTHVKESTLTGIDAATTGGMSLRKVSWHVPQGTGKEPVVSFPGKFTLYGECQSFGDFLDIKAATGLDDARISMSVFEADGFDDSDGVLDGASQVVFRDAGGEGDVDDVFNSASRWRTARLDVQTESGFVARLDLLLWQAVNSCAITGTAIAG